MGNNLKDEIILSLDNPGQIEKLYRENKIVFKEEFNKLYPEVSSTYAAAFWKERLNYQEPGISWGKKYEFIFVVVLSLIAGLIAKLPDSLGIDPEFFYRRNVGFLVFPFLSIYFFCKDGADLKKILIVAVLTIASLIFINVFPADENSDTLLLSCIHLPIFLWSLLGFTYIGKDLFDYKRRIEFLRFNGDLIVLTVIILLAGGILTGLTVGLFSLIDLQIHEFYMKNIAIFGLAAAPIVATYLIQTNTQLVKKVSPIIAKIFSPLVLLTLMAYLTAIIYLRKDPYNDREFLIAFNGLLVGVMAIILFSVVETSKSTELRFQTIILLLLSVVTVAVNGIALSAIVFRISEWGITPNRLAVLGSNILMLTNLLIITYKLFRIVSKKSEIDEVEKSIAAFLPVYGLWAMLVVFIFPLLFWFR